MFDENDLVDFPEESFRSSLFRILSADFPYRDSLDMPASQRHPSRFHSPPDLHACKLFFELDSVQGLPVEAQTSYTCSLRIYEEEKQYKLSLASPRDLLYEAHRVKGSASGSVWDSINDFFAPNRLVWEIRRKGWFSDHLLLTSAITLQDLLHLQQGSNSVTPALSSGGVGGEGSSSSGNSTQWCYRGSVEMELPRETYRFYHSSSKKRALMFPKDFRSTCPYQEEKSRRVKLNYSFRLVFLNRCVASNKNEFHHMAAYAPSQALADLMKALAAKSLLPRALSVTSSFTFPTTTAATADELSALEVALRVGNAETLMTLLERAGRLCFRPLRRGHACVLHDVVRGGNAMCFDILRRFLRKYGSTSSHTDSHLHFSTLLEWVDEKGHTPLTLACSLSRRNQQVLPCLLMAGADIGAINEESGQSALHYAAAAGSTSLVATLLSVTRSPHDLLATLLSPALYSSVDGNDNPRTGDDALSRHIRLNARSRRAVLGQEEDESETERSLACYPCKPGHQDKEGRQALHLAVSGGHVEICQLLLRAGVSLAARNLRGENVFHLCAQLRQNTSTNNTINNSKSDGSSSGKNNTVTNSRRIAELLVEWERTRWQAFLTHGQRRTLERMLPSQHVLLAWDGKGRSPQQVALEEGQRELAVYLLKAAIDIYQPSQELESVRVLQHLLDPSLIQDQEKEDDVVKRKCLDSNGSDKDHPGVVGYEGGEGERKNLDEEEDIDEAFADLLDYRFALNDWTARSVGLHRVEHG